MSPIFRPEQARLSIAAEAGQGGAYDNASGTDTGGGGGGVVDTAATVPGDKVVGTSLIANYAVGNYVQISAGVDSEVRKIRRADADGDGTGQLYLDYPLAFPHALGVALNEVESTFTAIDQFITYLPGVYENISVPEMTSDFQPKYFLGAQNRNWYNIYRGRQSFVGGLPNFLLINGYPLRFPIGSVATTGTDVGGGGGSTMSAASLKGARSIAVTDGTGYSNTDFVQIGTGATAEVRQIMSGASGAGAQTFVLNYPLMFAHANASVLNEVTSPYTHTIAETSVLDSLTWNILRVDSSETAANNWLERFVGGKVSRATIGAEEGGMLTMSWDDISFLDMVHNQQYHSSIGGGTSEISRYNGALSSPSVTFPTTEPYYFSQGTLSLFGVTFARVRNFRIEINNNIDPKYYIRDWAAERGPSETLEQRRVYRMTATIALPDSVAANATIRTLFKELLLEGNYTAGFTGFDFSLVFTRGSNDTLTITSPPSAAATGGNAEGCFFTRAPTNIGTEAPVQAEGEIIMRSMQIVVVDSAGVYP